MGGKGWVGVFYTYQFALDMLEKSGKFALEIGDLSNLVGLNSFLNVYSCLLLVGRGGSL